MKNTLTIICLMLASSLALADAPSYNYVGASYGIMDVHWAEENTEGWGLEGSAEITDNIFISGGFSEGRNDGVGYDASAFSLNMGYFAEYGTDSSWHTSIGLTRLDYEYIFTDGIEAILNWDVGVRNNLTDSIELNGGIQTTYSEYQTATALYVGTVVSAGNGLGIDLGLRFAPGNGSGIYAGIRYTF